MTPENLKDRKWRLNNLYSGVNTAGVKFDFAMNWAQEELYRDMWYLNAVLKARQLGITTFIDLMGLDMCLFNSNQKAGIIAHTQNDAEEIFISKVKFPYDNLDPLLKERIPVIDDSKRKLSFANGSSIRVGTSMRSGTLQFLHVSEYGKICAKYPEKAREIKTGSLNTIHEGSLAFLESTAEGMEGDFYDTYQAAEDRQKTDRPLTKLEFKPHFYPWYRHHAYRIKEFDYIVTPSELIEYFEELKHKHGIYLNEQQKAWYVVTWTKQQDDMKREYPSTPEEAFESSLIGAYYSRQLEKARMDRRITAIPHDPMYRVHTAWDIGIDDYTAIVFFQLIGHKIHVIDYLEGSDVGADYYENKLLQDPQYEDYLFGKHLNPHDIKKREWSSGQRSVDIALKKGFKYTVVPVASLDQSIPLVRQMFSRCYFDEQKAATLIKRLAKYRKKYNDKLGCFVDTPVHDESEHGSSAFRYMCEGVHNKLVTEFDSWAQADTAREAHLYDEYL